VRAERAEVGGLTAKVYGESRFDKSDRGWPMVDISQLDSAVVSYTQPASFAVFWRASECDSLDNTDHSRFGLMIHQVVDLVVAMDQCPPVLRLRFRIPQKVYSVIVVRYLSNRFLRLNITCLGLRG